MNTIDIFNSDNQVITILNTPNNLQIFASKGYFPKIISHPAPPEQAPVTTSIKLESEIIIPKMDVNTLAPKKEIEKEKVTHRFLNGRKKK